MSTYISVYGENMSGIAGVPVTVLITGVGISEVGVEEMNRVYLSGETHS